MKLLLISPPGAGKGTIGAMLSQRLGIPLISVGEVLRDVPDNSPFYKEINEYMNRGFLVPNDIVADVLRQRLNQSDCKEGFILDGWGRKLDDLVKLDPGFDKVIYLNISSETSIRRISGRRICDKDGTSCNIYTLPPKIPGHCDLCGGGLTQRADDKEEVVKERLIIFNRDTLPVINHFRTKGALLEIDAERKPEEIFKDVLSALGIEGD